MLLYKLAGLVQNWVILYPEEQKSLIQSKVEMIKEVAMASLEVNSHQEWHSLGDF